MDARDQRILVFGDSLTHEFADSSPEIWDVDLNSNRPSGSPGSLMASLLLEQGAQAVRTNSRVGRSAINFFGRENTQALLAADQAFAPTKVVIVLGTNDIGMSPDQTRAAMEKIREAYANMGAEVWAIGPFTYAGPGAMLNTQSPAIVDIMQDVFGGRFIDGRPLSVNVNRAGDGVHFGIDSARMTALNMAAALLDTAPPMSFLTTGLLIGAGVIGALAIWGAINKRRTGSLLGNLGRPAELDDGGDLDDVDEIGEISELPELAELPAHLELDGDKTYRVAYVDTRSNFYGGSFVVREYVDQLATSIEQAEKAVRSLKRRGRTAWVEDDDGNLVPVKGAKKRPTFVENMKTADKFVPGRDERQAGRWTDEDSADAGRFGERYRALMLDPDPASMKIIEDAALEQGWRLSNVSGPQRGRRGFFDMHRAGAPSELWKGVSWNIIAGNNPGDHGPARIDIVVSNGKARVSRVFDVKAPGTGEERHERIRSAATADAWAIAKAIKALPLDTPENELRRIVDAALAQDNSEPSELYG